ncbi:hypothetical protein HMPREF9719_00062 [Corynebacterium otitidis ATCC 51513]|uniref:DNA repair ATPase n=2 Tax=Corynebacterium otitidis ATCC 51513 TaxID=883169 RepID=K0YIM6_9CORY|nr:hypothetical protein HMPREF9719_00062 [Corynebacterium otitidis ATCC 51513]
MVNAMTTPGSPHRRIPSPGDLAGRAGARKAPRPGGPTGPSPEKFGRIDDEGRVLAFVDGGEREVGQWQAGSKDEGLRHFARRFEDLRTEVDMLERRLRDQPGDAAAIRSSAREIAEGLPTAAVLGDREALRRRLDGIVEDSFAVAERFDRDREEAAKRALERKTALAEEAETIAAESTDWKAAGDRLAAIVEEWRSIDGPGRSKDRPLWARLSKARSAFKQRRGSHFADLDRQRAQARRRKEELVAAAEEIQDSEDWAETGRKFRDLMREWKAAGHAPRAQDDRLWERFSAAQDRFFDRRHAVEAERDREFEANAKAKDELLESYGPRIDAAGSIDEARGLLRELQERWEDAGFVPRSKKQAYEEKIRGLEERVADAERAEWRRTDPEARARVEQFAGRAEDLARQAADAAKAGKEKKAEELSAQAEQWREWARTADEALKDR